MNGIRDTSALVRAAFAVVTAVGAVHIAQSSFQIFRLALRIGPKAAITVKHLILLRLDTPAYSRDCKLYLKISEQQRLLSAYTGFKGSYVLFFKFGRAFSTH